MSPRASKRLVQLFERDLRDLDADLPGKGGGSQKPTKPRVSRELDQQVVEFAAETRTSGSTPEKMLVELKQLLAGVAPEIPSSQRNTLVASLTRRAIDAFFGSSAKPKDSE